MRIKKIKKGVTFHVTKRNDGYSTYYYGQIRYEDDVIDFGKVIAYSSIPNAKKGYFLFDDKYVYECLMSRCISNIFDIENRCEIDSIQELIKIRKEYASKNPKKKLK